MKAKIITVLLITTVLSEADPKYRDCLKLVKEALTESQKILDDPNFTNANFESNAAISVALGAAGTCRSALSSKTYEEFLSRQEDARQEYKAATLAGKRPEEEPLLCEHALWRFARHIPETVTIYHQKEGAKLHELKYPTINAKRVVMASQNVLSKCK